eukprot:2753921-Amphidinium_carterae.1
MSLERLFGLSLSNMFTCMLGWLCEARNVHGLGDGYFGDAPQTGCAGWQAYNPILPAQMNPAFMCPCSERGWVMSELEPAIIAVIDAKIDGRNRLGGAAS